MREAQRWSGRTSPRIGPLLTRSYTSFPWVFLHTDSLPDEAPPPRRVSSALLLHA
jgi:hypothetical protein